MNHFRDIQIYKRKLQKAISKKNEEKIKRIKETKPRMNIDHVVRERYQNFEDALKDLDDCISSLALFQSMPAH